MKPPERWLDAVFTTGPITVRLRLGRSRLHRIPLSLRLFQCLHTEKMWLSLSEYDQGAEAVNVQVFRDDVTKKKSL